MLTKKKYKDEIASGNPTNTAIQVSKKRPAPTTPLKAGKKTKGVIKEETGSDLEDHASISQNPATPRKTPSKICLTRAAVDTMPTTPDEESSGARTVPKRSSPRATKPVDYNVLNDPFMKIKEATDQDGQNVFGEDEGTSSDDSADSDEIFSGAKEDLEAEEEDQEA